MSDVLGQVLTPPDQFTLERWLRLMPQARKTELGIGPATDGDKGDISISSDTYTINNGTVTAAMTTITETPDGTKYLRDDWSWQAVSGGSGLTHPQVMARGLGG